MLTLINKHTQRHTNRYSHMFMHKHTHIYKHKTHTQKHTQDIHKNIHTYTNPDIHPYTHLQTQKYTHSHNTCTSIKKFPIHSYTPIFSQFSTHQQTLDKHLNTHTHTFTDFPINICHHLIKHAYTHAKVPTHSHKFSQTFANTVTFHHNTTHINSYTHS